MAVIFILYCHCYIFSYFNGDDETYGCGDAFHYGSGSAADAVGDTLQLQS
jgi:hypothetical protein